MVHVPRADERDPRRRSAEPHAPRTTRRHHDHDRRGGARHGLFYPPDPGSMRISTIGGNVAENSGGLRGLEIRRHARLCDGDRSRAGRRPNRAVRQPLREGRRRLLDEGSVHRIGRHARHHHRGPAEAGAAPGGPADHAGALRSDRGRGGNGVRDHRGAASSRARWSSSIG